MEKNILLIIFLIVSDWLIHYTTTMLESVLRLYKTQMYWEVAPLLSAGDRLPLCWYLVTEVRIKSRTLWILTL